MNFFKTGVFSFLSCISLVNIIESASAMDDSEKTSIKQALTERVERAFRGPNLPNYELTETGKGLSFDGDGYIYYPKNLTCKEDFTNFIEQANIPRNKFNSIRDYKNQVADDKTMVIGSGLTQETIQPITALEFKNAFYVDEAESMHPDIVSSFGFSFVFREDVVNFQGTFDGLYLDNFPGLFEEEIIQAAALMVRPGGTVKWTYRPNDEIRYSILPNYLKNKSKYSEEYREIEIPHLLERIEKCGFKNVGYLNYKQSIRAYGYSFYTIYATKQ